MNLLFIAAVIVAVRQQRPCSQALIRVGSSQHGNSFLSPLRLPISPSGMFYVLLTTGGVSFGGGATRP